MLPGSALLIVTLLGLLTVQAQDTREVCPGYQPRLQVGTQGVVAPGPDNNVRSQPTLGGVAVGQLPAGETFTILDGPQCADGYTWWYIESASLQGWTAAGTPDEYFLQPLATANGAQQPTTAGQEGQSNVAFILDASGSMQATLPNGERRITAAQRALGDLSTAIPANVNASLWVFGHRVGNSEAERPQSCQDIEQLIPLGPVSGQQFQAAANNVIARGWTPLTSTIEQAASTLPPASDNTIVVISDGEETCGGDPCAVAEALHNSNIELVVNTIGFDVDATTREQLQCIARVSDGQYYDAADADELNFALEQAAAPDATIQLQDTNGDPLNVYYTLADADTGELVAEGPGVSRVPAGRYIVAVEGYNPQTIRVESGQTVNITLEAIQPTTPPLAPTEIREGTYFAVDDSGEVLPDVTFELENVATLDDFTANGNITVPAGEYRGRLRVPLADDVTQNIRLQDTGQNTIAPNQDIFININDYFGEPVTFQVADGAGNLLPNAQIDIAGQYCIGEVFATFTGEAIRYREPGVYEPVCLTVTVDGETYRPYTVNNINLNELDADTQTLTIFDGLTFRTPGTSPPGIARVQAVASSGEPYPDGRTPFIIPTNQNDVTWWRGPNSSRGTYFYVVPGEWDVSLGSTARSYLTTINATGGQVIPVEVVQNDDGRYIAPEDTPLNTREDNTSQGADVVFFDDFEQEGVSDLRRGYAGWENWNVVAGSVDAINAARAGNVDESYGVMVDLDGSSRTSGIITTREQFQLEPGDYTFQFEASSSRQGEPNTFRVVVTDFVVESVTVSTDQPMQTYTYSFTVTEPTAVNITFDHTPTPGDNEGAFIDNVLLTQGVLVGAQPADTTPVSPTIFFDDFEQEGGRSTDYTGWQNWDVVAGTVDSHTTDSARFNHLDPSYGTFMELDGSSNQSGAVTTKDVFTLEPGEYTLSFEAAGANLDGPHTFVVGAGPFVMETVSTSADQSMLPYSYTFTVEETTDIRLAFDHTAQPGDNRGPVIDNVWLVRGSPH